jgi:aminoglycoside/choline kinase family phosphotransferase
VSDALGIQTLTIEWLAGDGSDRCYYRVRSPELKASHVLMQLSGTDLENLRTGTYDWVEISKILNDSGILAPKTVAILREHGSLIIDDYGDDMLETLALEEKKNGNISNTLSLYADCIQTLSKMISIRPVGAPSWTRRSFDEARFIWELDFFVQKYLEGVCGRSLSAAEKSLFSKDSLVLARFLSSGSKYFVHRDFHSRNVMVWHGKIAVIDFQDARLGPVSYDLVSLCFDSYVPFSHKERLDILDQGLRCLELNHGAAIGDEARAQWKATLLQRQIKAIGSFGYLTVDKKKGDYLKNVAPALKTLLDAGLQDSRWPFLSGDLLEMIKLSLPTVAEKLSQYRDPNRAPSYP